MSGLHRVALGLLCVAALVAAMLTGRDAEDPSPDVTEGASRTPGSGIAGTETGPTSTNGGGGASTTARPPKEELIPFEQRREALMEDIAELGAALRIEREIERVETEAEEQMREEAWSHMVEGLVLKVRADPRQADAMVAMMDATDEEALAIRMARILRRAEHPELLAAMKERVTGGTTAMQRRTAMLILETRDAALWLEPVSEAYRKDPEASVRDEAGGFLARSLADQKHLRVHNQMRETIQTGLDAEDPTVRSLALRTMLGDRRPRPADLERAKALLDDKDEGVKRAAQRAIRVLQPILDRALKRRGER